MSGAAARPRIQPVRVGALCCVGTSTGFSSAHRLSIIDGVFEEPSGSGEKSERWVFYMHLLEFRVHYF